MNAKLGRTCSLLTGIGVGAFALSMLAGQPLWSYASGLLIALGFVGMIASFAALASADRRATTNAALVFAGAYATVVVRELLHAQSLSVLPEADAAEG